MTVAMNTICLWVSVYFPVLAHYHHQRQGLSNEPCQYLYHTHEHGKFGYLLSVVHSIIWVYLFPRLLQHKIIWIEIK